MLEQVVGDEHLTVAVHASADADGGDVQTSGDLLRHVGRNTLEHDAESTRFLDRDGVPVVSRRDTARLARLAAATGGQVFPGDAWGAIDLDRATSAIRQHAGDVPGERVERRVRGVRVAPLAALAFALLLVEGLPWPRNIRVLRWLSGRIRGIAVAALAGVAVFATPAPAGDTAPGGDGPEAPGSTLCAATPDVHSAGADTRRRRWNDEPYRGDLPGDRSTSAGC